MLLTSLRRLLPLLGLCPLVLAADLAVAQSPPAGPNPSRLGIPYTEAQLRAALTPATTELPDISATPGRLPPDAAAGLFDQVARFDELRRTSDQRLARYEWQAAESFHRPLYFEDVMLERHGHARHPLLQPIVSGARFFTTFPILAYQLQLDPPRKRISTLGHYRPGSPAPAALQHPRFRWDAGLVEAGAVVGLIFLVP